MALLLCAGQSVAEQPQSLEQISAQLVQAPVLRGQFAQSKQIAGFNNPLRSTGRLLLAHDRGVVWQTLQPFPSTIVLSQEQLISRGDDGSSKVLIAADNGTATSAVQALLMALIAGDFQQLSTQFAIQPLVADQGWALRLLPSDPLLQRVFDWVELRGDRYVQQVQMSEPSGDRSEIVFSDLSNQPEQLSTDEVALFE